MDEFDLIRRHFARNGEAPGVITGIGDDGAVLQPEAGRELVAVIDTLVERTHFPADIRPADLGYRAVAVNLSDLAAMGARPLWMTLALTMPDKGEPWIEAFSSGLFEAANEYGVSLVGGDTTAGESVVVSVHLTGDVARGSAILRNGAQPGDAVYVTGALGDAAAGLSVLGAGGRDDQLVNRYWRPSARVAVGLELAGIASACIDISDGFAGDLSKLLDASRVGADVDLDTLPLSRALRAAFDADACRQFATTGGDDYELCFTSRQPLPANLAGVPVTAVGTIIEGRRLICRSGGAVVDVDASGYRHFQ